MRSPTSCDTHDVRQGVVRRQVVGLSGRAVQCVRMGLRATGIFRYSDCIAGRLPYLLGSCSSDTTGESLYIMPVAGQLLDREGRAADSAGNTRPSPSTPCLPGLRRGSHNARNSTAAGCWQHRNWPRKGCACATGCRQFVRFRDRNQRPMSLTQEPRSWKFLFQIQRRQKYAYAQPAAPR